MNRKSLSIWNRITVIGISLGLVMIGWTGFRSNFLYFVIGVISTLVLLFRISNKPPAGGVRCWAICISILISSFIPILFYDKGIFKIVSTDNTGLSTIIDLTSYLPYSNFNELVRFNVESAARWILGIVVFRFLCSTFCSQENAIRSLFIRSWIFGVLASITAQLLQFLNNFPSIWLFAYDYRAFNGRFPGLSDHPNTISIIVCLSVPLLYFSGHQKRHQRYILFLFFTSELLAQSRIGTATFILTLVLCEWRTLHKKFSFALVFTFGAILILFLYKLSLFNSIIESSRFNTSNIYTQQSDSGRWILVRFGWNTFLENPIFGVGPRAFKESHNIFIQVLASLGFFGLIGFFDFLIRPLLLKYGRDLEPFLAKICLLAFMFVGLFNNKLTDFYLYFPLILSLQILLSNKKNQEFDLSQANKS